jgi:hypothetical protein
MYELVKATVRVRILAYKRSRYQSSFSLLIFNTFVARAREENIKLIKKEVREG